MDTPDFLEICAREKTGQGEEWKLYLYEVKDSPFGRFFELTGAVAPPITRGKNKGQPNWKKLDKATEQTVQVTSAEKDARREKWEQETGLCSSCLNTGAERYGWSQAQGVLYRDCTRCDRKQQSDEHSLLPT